MSDAIDNNNTTIDKDTVVTFDYRLSRDDNGQAGEFIESSEGGNSVLYLHGHRNMIPGLEKAMAGRKAGESFAVTVTAEEGYGQRQDDAVRRVPCKHIHEYKKGKNFRPGQIVTVQTNQGRQQVVILKAGKFNVDVDFNHPLAGQALYYEITIVDVRPATSEELAHGHAHGPGGHHH